MIFIKKDEQSRNALKLIQHVLQAHQDMLEQKESELVCIASEEIKNEINSILENKAPQEKTFSKADLISQEIEVIDIKIAAIQYTYDYVKLMLKQCEKLEKNT